MNESHGDFYPSLVGIWGVSFLLHLPVNGQTHTIRRDCVTIVRLKKNRSRFLACHKTKVLALPYHAHTHFSQL